MSCHPPRAKGQGGERAGETKGRYVMLPLGSSKLRPLPRLMGFLVDIWPAEWRFVSAASCRCRPFVAESLYETGMAR